MKNPTQLEPYLADWGEADMREHPRGKYVDLYDYLLLYKAYEEALKGKSTRTATKGKVAQKASPKAKK